MSLEDRIISFLDGGLSPTERSALLREVHRTPGAKELLESHRMLRSMAKASARSISAPAIFASRLPAIAATAPVMTVHHRVRRFAPVMLLFMTAIGIIAGLELNQPVPRRLSIAPSTAASSAEVLRATIPVGRALPVASSNSVGGSEADHLVSNQGGWQAVDLPQPILPDLSESIVIGAHPSQEVIPARELDIEPSFFGRANSLQALRVVARSQTETHFETSLQTSSGFTSPADAQPIKPFAQQRLGIGYFVTTNDVVGVRLSSGLYQVPGAQISSSEGGVTLIQQNLETRRSWGGEVYLSHRFDGLLSTPLVAVLTATGGFIPNGYTFGAEAGIRIPAGNDFSFAVDFALERVHSNTGSSQAVLANTNADVAPIMYSGTNIRNTLNGSIHYGIAYNF